MSVAFTLLALFVFGDAHHGRQIAVDCRADHARRRSRRSSGSCDCPRHFLTDCGDYVAHALHHLQMAVF
jgi:hypothetical protein